ncbi:MAG TPA: sugar phosphate isomerase/epimerase [Terriglobales bacterium]|nr:sugar phosphate isomerase/epimerase [Terriglobales bacterium]
MTISRRKFLASAGVVGGAALIEAIPPANALLQQPLYPAINLAYFQKPITPVPELRIGYAAITWGGRDREAIKDISAVGYKGIQLRSNCIAEFSSPQAVHDLLAAHSLRFVALSSGDLQVDPPDPKAAVGHHVENAKFLRDAGGMYLQIIDRKPKHQPTAADYKRLGQLLTELGKQTADIGIPLGYHNHMGALGQTPEAVDRIMAACDPRYVKLELDIAHYFEGGDPAHAIRKYRDRLLFLHIKDVKQFTPESNPKPLYEFAELGQGKVDLPAVLAALREINFRGWGIVELDGETESKHTPKESAEVSKSYLQKAGIAL